MRTSVEAIDVHVFAESLTDCQVSLASIARGIVTCQSSACRRILERMETVAKQLLNYRDC